MKPIWIFAIDRQVQNITGLSDYGVYFALLNFCILFSFLLDPGININMNREASARPSDSIEIFSASLNGKIWMIMLYMAVVLVASWLSGIRDMKFLMMLILVQTGSSLLSFIRVFLTAMQHYRLDAIISVTDKIFIILAAGFLILFPHAFGPITISRFVWIQMAGIAVSMCIGITFLFIHVRRFTLRPMTGFRKEIIFSSLPFALNIFLMSIIARADGFLLERLHVSGSTEAGIYATGYRMMDAFNMLCSIVAGFLLPFISRNWPNSGAFSGALMVCRQVLMFLAIITAAFALAEPQYITGILYHRTDEETVMVMRIIMLVLPSLTLISMFGTLLTATGNIKTFIMLSLTFAVLSLILNMILIPRYGAVACAVVAVIIQSLYAITIILFSRFRTGIGISISDIWTYTSTAFMFYGSIRLLSYSGLGVLMSVSVSSLLAALLFFYTTDISFQKIRLLLKGK